MKKSCILGYSISILGGILMIASAFLSLTMTSFAGVLTQGDSLFVYLTSGLAGYSSLFSTAIVFYSIAIVLSVVAIICSVILLVMSIINKYNVIFLLILRILTLFVFMSILIALMLLGFYVSTIEAELFNFIGIGISVAVLASLLIVMGTFFARAKQKTNDKDEN